MPPRRWRDVLRRYGTLVSFFALVLFGLWLGRGVLVPFALALFLVYILAPVVRWLARQRVRGRRIPRWVAVLVVYAGLIGGVYVFSVTAVPRLANEMGRLVQDAPVFFRKVRGDWVPALNARLQILLADVFAAEDEAGVPVMDLNVQVTNALQGAVDAGLAHVADALKLGQRLVAGLIGAFVSTVLTLMIAAFILIDLDQIHAFFRSLVPAGAAERYDELLRRLDRGLAGVIRGQLLICLVNGTLTFIGLSLIGVPFALILATVAGVLSLIPIFGTILSSIPAVAIGLTQSLVTGLLVLGWILLIHFVEANFLNPKIIGTAAHIHPALVVFALVVGEHTAGLLGALLAVPILSIIQTLFLFVRSLTEPAQQEP